MSETNGKELPFVFLSQPGYGEQTAGAARGFWRATRLPDHRVYRSYREGSLLAANFNGLWVDCLNLNRRSQPVDYFAMIHADVEPADWWLDTLIAEMDAKDLDVLGCVVPIKDPNGLTSIAIDRPDGDTWRPHCRLTMSEVFRLPETFTGDDLGGHRILLNTGLWVCRFDESWARKVHFTINDRIVTDPNGNYFAQCEPEDWFFSRLCHELGLRVGCTRKIPLKHRGVFQFPNDHIWGLERHDSAWIEETIVPDMPEPEPPDDLPGWKFPSDVEGWLSREEGIALARLAKGKRVLEIGSYCGRSTICMGQVAENVVAIDPFDGSATPNERNTFDEFKENIERYGVKPVVDWFMGTLESVNLGRFYKSVEDNPDDLSGHLFDFVFIDGDHGYDAVTSDIANVLPLLAPDAQIAFHDFRNHPGEYDGRWDAGVTRAVNELLSRGGELVSRSGTVAVVKPPAESLVTSEV